MRGLFLPTDSRPVQISVLSPTSKDSNLEKICYLTSRKQEVIRAGGFQHVETGRLAGSILSGLCSHVHKR
jgi:hypothetical protein